MDLSKKNIFAKKSLYVEKNQGSDPKFSKNYFFPKFFFLQKRSLKVTKGQKSILYSNERYLQMQSNGDLQKVIQGHPRSRKVKNRYFSENSSASRVRRPDSRGGGGGSFRVGGRANFYAGRIAYSECEYISVFTEFIVRFSIFYVFFYFIIFYLFFVIFFIYYLFILISFFSI